MVLESSHNLELVEERDPMEKGKEKSLRVFIESLASTVNRDVIIDKFDGFLFIRKGRFHEIFLNTMKAMYITSVEDCIAHLSPLEIEETSSIANFRHSINNISMNIPFELLREVFEESCAV